MTLLKLTRMEYVSSDTYKEGNCIIVDTHDIRIYPVVVCLDTNMRNAVECSMVRFDNLSFHAKETIDEIWTMIQTAKR